MKKLLLILLITNCFSFDIINDVMKTPLFTHSKKDENILRDAEYFLAKTIQIDYKFSKNKFKMVTTLNKGIVESLKQKYPEVMFDIICYTYNNGKVIDSTSMVYKDEPKTIYRHFIPVEIGTIEYECSVTILNTKLIR